MRAVEKLTATSWLTDWQVTGAAAVFGWLLAAALGLGYLALWVRARRRHPDRAPSPARLVWFFVVGILPLVYALCGPPAIHAHTLMWVFALQVAMLDAVVPLGLALGRPLDVVAAAFDTDLPDRFARSLPVRVLTFPLVASSLAATSILTIFVSGYGEAAQRSAGVHALLVVQLLLVGSLVVLPLLTDGMLPRWATPGARAVIAAADGLIDAIPGIVLMTAQHLLMPGFAGFTAGTAVRGDLSPSLDQRYAGGALLAVTESIGIPLLIAVFIDWQRADQSEAHATDARLDAELGEGQSLTTPWWLQHQTPGAAQQPGQAQPTVEASATTSAEKPAETPTEDR